MVLCADWGLGEKPVMTGFVWDWEYTSALKKDLALVVCDPLIRLQKSDDRKYYSAGMSTEALVGDILSRWNIPYDYQWRSVTHPKMALKTQTVGAMITEILKDAQNKTGDKYVLNYQENKLHILPRGYNEDVYVFTPQNTVSTSHKRSMDDMITKVTIIGKEDKAGRAPIEATLTGNAEFGVLQKIIQRDKDTSLSDVRAEGQTLLKEHGQPKETIRVSAPDIPYLRRGWKIRMRAGDLDRYYHVLGVSHNATAVAMQLEVTRV
jgi:hypothetical protein